MDELVGDPGASPRSLHSLLAYGDRLLSKIGGKFPPLGRLLAHFPLSARGLLLALVGLLLLLLLPSLVERLLQRFGRVEANFRGDRIPQSYGLVILLWAAALLTLQRSLYPNRHEEGALWLTLLIGFGALGFLDDTWGDKRFKGLRGHFRAAFRERKLTTGFVKAIGGAALALWLGHALEPDNPLSALLSGGLIALSANAVNLLDLRPGRAGGVFLILAALWLVYSGLTGAIPVPLLFVFVPTLLVWERDARALVMLGDTGSNLLGASLGLALAMPATPLPLKGFALVVLLALHLLVERLSLTALIEKQPLLRALDRLTGIRE